MRNNRYAQWYTASVLLIVLLIIVTPLRSLANSSASLASDKAVYTSGETISISFDGAAGYALDWVGIFPVDAAPDSVSPLMWLRTSGSNGSTSNGIFSGQLDFDSSNLNIGQNYEARMFFNNIDGVIEASSDPFTIVAAGSGATATLVADKSSYVLGEDMTISFTGAVGYAGDWVGIFPVGAAANSVAPLMWLRTNGTNSSGSNGITSGQLVYNSSNLNIGEDYEARMFFNNIDGVIEASSDPFTIVAAGSGTTATLVADKTSYVLGEDMTISFTGAAGYAGDWVGIFPVGAAANSVAPLMWLRTNGTNSSGSNGITSGQLVYNSSNLNIGQDYEARMFFNNIDGVIEASSDPFTIVATGTGTTATLVADKSSYTLGEDITISFDGAAGYALDWVGIFPIDAAPDSVSPLMWLRTSGSNGSTSNGITSGQLVYNSSNLSIGQSFEARMFFNNIDGVIEASSDPFTIVAAGTGTTATLVADKSSYTQGEDITISFDGAAGYALDWVGIFPVAAASNSVSPLMWLRTSGSNGTTSNGITSGQLVYNSSNLSIGQSFEARMFFNNIDGVIEASSDPFTVTAVGSNTDTDGDGLSNELELANGLDPNDPSDAAQDADNDGLSNIDELLTHDTDPNNADTDADGLPDGLEITLSLSPNQSDTDGNGVNDGLEDSDGDGVTNVAELLAGTDAANPDSDGDGLNDGQEAALGTNPNNADTDDDGVDDFADTYPIDPQRTQLAAVTGFAGSLQSETIALNWDAYTDQSLFGGFRLERRIGLAEDIDVLLGQSAIDLLSHNDDQVENGQGYQYRITALDTRGNAGVASDWLALFVAYNTTQISDLSADRTDQVINLQWNSTAVDGYRVYRQTASDGFVALADTTANSSSDTSILAHVAYGYAVSTLRAFHNPFTDTDITLEGPRSSSVTLDATYVYTLELSLPDATKTTDDNYRLTIDGDSALALNGRYVGALGSVRITATKGDKTLSTTSDNGAFYLRFNADDLGSWTISAQDLDPSQTNNTASVTLLLTTDSDGPVLTLDAGLATSTAADAFVLRGTALDSDSGVNDVFARSDRFVGVSFQGDIGSGGAFSVSVPLLHGPNSFTIVAEDEHGNTSTVSHSVERAVSLVPVLNWLSPDDGSSTTDERIDVVGRIYTNQAANDLRVLIDGNLVAVNGEGGDAGYSFSQNVLLALGSNTLSVSVESPGGDVAQSRVLRRIDPNTPGEESEALSLSLSAPLQGAVSSSHNITLSGTASGGSGTLALVINGQSVPLVGQSFTTTVSLAHCDGTTQTIPLYVSDSIGHTLDETIDVRCDDTAPAITLQTPVGLVADANNPVLENPLPVSGLVTDANLAGLSLNGQSLALIPTGEANTYRFEVLLRLSDGENQLDLHTWDKANNNQSLSYALDLSLAVQLTVLAPQPGSELSFSTDAITLDVLAQAAGLSAGDGVSVVINDASPLAMTLDGETARLSPTLQLQEGENTLIIKVHDAQGVLQTQTRVLFDAVIDEEVELAVERSEPAANSQANAPNDPLMLYFNKPVRLDEISLIVTQSAHGPNYDLRNQQAAAFTEFPKPELVQVNIDQQPVEGGLAPFSNDLVLGFYPKEPLQYGATVYVEVLHNGQSLKRFSYGVQELPTLVTGIVTDVFDHPVASLLVSIPELGLSSITDSFGNYAFGGGEEHKIPLASGQFKLHLNPEQENPAWGTSDHWITIQQSRVNQIVPIKVPIIASTEPFVPLQGGDVFSLYRGAIELDLTDATLQFAKGRDSGNVQVQMLLLNDLSHQPTLAAVPQFAWHLQAGVDGLPGVGVEGEVNLKINIPRYQGGYEHVPLNETRVVILGLADRSLNIMPVGVGKVQGRQIVNTTPLVLARLDYIAYAVVPYEKYPHLWAYETGDYRTIAQLRAKLEESQ